MAEKNRFLNLSIYTLPWYGKRSSQCLHVTHFRRLNQPWPNWCNSVLKCKSTSEERKSFVFALTETIISCYPWEKMKWNSGKTCSTWIIKRKQFFVTFETWHNHYSITSVTKFTCYAFRGNNEFFKLCKAQLYISSDTRLKKHYNQWENTVWNQDIQRGKYSASVRNFFR